LGRRNRQWFVFFFFFALIFLILLPRRFSPVLALGATSIERLLEPAASRRSVGEAAPVSWEFFSVFSAGAPLVPRPTPQCFAPLGLEARPWPVMARLARIGLPAMLKSAFVAGERYRVFFRTRERAMAKLNPKSSARNVCSFSFRLIPREPRWRKNHENRTILGGFSTARKAITREQNPPTAHTPPEANGPGGGK